MKGQVIFGGDPGSHLPTPADGVRHRPNIIHHALKRLRTERLLSVAQRLLGIYMDFNQQAVGADGHGSAGHVRY